MQKLCHASNTQLLLPFHGLYAKTMEDLGNNVLQNAKQSPGLMCILHQCSDRYRKERAGRTGQLFPGTQCMEAATLICGEPVSEGSQARTHKIPHHAPRFQRRIRFAWRSSVLESKTVQGNEWHAICYTLMYESSNPTVAGACFSGF
jgi:hypothetical protein